MHPDLPPNMQNTPIMAKNTAKDVIQAALPVPEQVLHMHQAQVANLTAKMRQRKAMERQQVRGVCGKGGGWWGGRRAGAGFAATSPRSMPAHRGGARARACPRVSS